MKVSTTLLFCFVLTIASAEEVLTAKVVNVLDGNTLEVLTAGNQIQKIVLAGIDCPEPGQQFAEKATKLLEKLVLDKDVKVCISGKDRWGNYVATVTVIKNGVDPRVELLEEGLAWTAERNPVPDLESIRLKALEKQRGLWKESDPKAPWIYRREQSMMHAKSS